MQEEEKPSRDQEEPDIPEGAILAAIDLGSNSFHLIIARIEHEEMRTIDTLAEKVQLGAGLKDGKLDKAAIKRGLDCLSRFKQLLDSVEPYRIRIVGTNALRQADNRRDFTSQAEQMLGVPVNVIYGREEARLVYLGVAHTLADDEQSRLVVDIGGGSTEFIVGKRFEPTRLDSLQLGCVSYTRTYMPEGVIGKKAYRRMYEAARLQLSHIRNHYKAGRWDDCVGSSGTLQAIEQILLHFGWSEQGITRNGLSCLEKALFNFKHIDDIDIESLSESRRNVITAGVAITSAIFDELNIEIMRSSRGALREGVIYDLLGRLSHEDVRERTITALMQRYNSDPGNAEIAERRARILYRATRKAWQLDSSDWQLLGWAARSHEIGMAISHKNFNRHGAYVLRNADLPGFAQHEQETLALLVHYHRGKINAEALQGMSRSDRAYLVRLITLLRLASCFKYVEQLEFLPEFRVHAENKALHLQFPEGWLKQHPLTRQELAQQRVQLRKIGMRLRID